MATKTKEPTTEGATRETREMHIVESQRGKVIILKEGESQSGVYTLKEGRKIGDYDSPTLELYDPTTNSINLIPMNSVLEGKVNSALDKYGDNYHFLNVTYLGKRQGKENEYNDFELSIGEATADEIAQLGDFEAKQA